MSWKLRAGSDRHWGIFERRESCRLNRSEHPRERDRSFHSLNKLQNSAKNARKTPHVGLRLTPLRRVSRPRASCKIWSLNQSGTARRAVTGFYVVATGEGRRLAQLPRVKRKEIKKTEPIRCIIDTTSAPHEICLDENVTRKTCIRLTSSRRSRTWPKAAGSARRSPPVSTLRRRRCGSGFRRPCCSRLYRPPRVPPEVRRPLLSVPAGSRAVCPASRGADQNSVCEAERQPDPPHGGHPTARANVNIPVVRWRRGYEIRQLARDRRAVRGFQGLNPEA
jgi:hypothetical protein